MIEVQELRYGRTHDIGICSVTKRKTQWNDGCRDGFRCRQYIGGKPYMVCFNCIEWDGKTKLKQSRLDDKKAIREILDRRQDVMRML